MSFGFSPSDILTGLKICKWICDVCFDKKNSADKHYKQLGNDVKSLDTSLKQLEDALKQATERCENPDFGNVDLVGDFPETLEQCKAILEKNIKLRGNRAGVFQNGMWAASTHDKVEALRKRIQFHTQKINLLIEPVKLGLLTTMNDKMDEMLERARVYHPLPTPLDPIPEWLESEFRRAILVNPPANFTEISHIPLEEGCYALYGHFANSTHAFQNVEKAEQTAEQYINLLKSQWMIEIIRKSGPFQQAHPGAFHPRTLAQLEQKIIRQHRRVDLVRFSNEDLQQLNINSSSFLIWPPEEVQQLRSIADANIGENEILRLSLPTTAGYQGDSLVLFRTGPKALRIVRTVVPRNPGTLPYFESERFNTHIDKFIPLYAVQESFPELDQRRGSHTAYNLGIYRGNETEETSYVLKQEKDVWQFQRAVTGYQVVYDGNVAWALNQSGKLLRGKGKLQIWHWKPLTKTSTTPDSTSEISTSTQSTFSQVSRSSTASSIIAGEVLKETGRSNVSFHESSENESTILATTPPQPVIMIYTKVKGEYTYLHLELDFGLQIVEASCKCDSNNKKVPNTCQRSVVEKRARSRSELPFQVRRMSVIPEWLNSWNLSLFAQPKHPELDTNKSVKRLACYFLQLDFDTIPDRELFGKRFETALQCRDDAERSFQALCKRMQTLSEQPKSVSGGKSLSKLSRSQTSSSSSMTVRSPSTSMKPPRLNSISSFSSLQLDEVDIFRSSDQAWRP